MIELSYLIYPLSICTHIIVNLGGQNLIPDMIVDLMVSIPQRIKVSLEVKAEHKVLYDIFARTQDFNL